MACQAPILSVRRLRERHEGSGAANSWPPISIRMPPLPSAVGKKVSKSISSFRLSDDAKSATFGNREVIYCLSKEDSHAYACGSAPGDVAACSQAT
jgi:hypothetical protein